MTKSVAPARQEKLIMRKSSPEDFSRNEYSPDHIKKKRNIGVIDIAREKYGQSGKSVLFIFPIRTTYATKNANGIKIPSAIISLIFPKSNGLVFFMHLLQT
jgi:hypothetical protein